MAVSTKDLLAEALDRVIEQLRGKPDFASLVSTFTAQVSGVQAAILGVLDDTIVAASEGAQLDGLGDIVGEERFARDDTIYRIAILARIRLNISNGTMQDIIALIEAVIGGAFTIRVDEYQPAAFIANVLEPIDPTMIDPGVVGAIVRSGKPAGVGSGVHFHVADPFQYDTGFGFDTGKYADVF